MVHQAQTGQSLLAALTGQGPTLSRTQHGAGWNRSHQDPQPTRGSLAPRSSSCITRSFLQPHIPHPNPGRTLTVLPPRWARSQSTAGAEAARHHRNPTRPRRGAMRCDAGRRSRAARQAGLPEPSIIPYVLCKSVMLKMYGVNYQGSLLGVKFIQ